MFHSFILGFVGLGIMVSFFVVVIVLAVHFGGFSVLAVKAVGTMVSMKH